MFALPKLLQRHSPNFSSRQGTPISLVVEHDTEGGYPGTLDWLCNPHVPLSAHLVVKEDGSECTQLVGFQDKAWHAMNAGNFRGIGKEWAGFENKGYSDAQLAANAAITAWLCRVYGIPPRWAESGQGSGVCRHYDLGAAGGSHDDPTMDPVAWGAYMDRVETAYAVCPTPPPLWAQHMMALNPYSPRPDPTI